MAKGRTMREIPLVAWATLFLTSFNFLIHGLPQYFLLFLVWTIPVWIFWFWTRAPFGDPKPLVLAALAAYLVSIVIDLNLLSHLALALSIAAFIPLTPYSIVWIFGSLFWIPAGGWILNKFDLNDDLIKLGGIVALMTPLLYWEWRER